MEFGEGGNVMNGVHLLKVSFPPKELCHLETSCDIQGTLPLSPGVGNPTGILFYLPVTDRGLSGAHFS